MHDSLNSYQQTMLQWNSLHPYNSVHVLRIGSALEFERLQEAVNETLQTHGILELSLNRGRRTYQYNAGAVRYEIKLIKDYNPHAALISEMERELNSAFPVSERFRPFRFFVVPEKDGFFLGVVFFHMIADGHSIVLLMRDIFDRYEGRKVVEPQAFDLYPGRYDKLFRRPVLLVRRLASLPSDIRSLRTSCRFPYIEREGSGIRLTFFSLKPEKLDLLLQAARSSGVTVNDLLLALMMKCLAPVCKLHERPKRRKISIGCVVNTRAGLGLTDQRKFGLFLGTFVVTRSIPNDVEIKDIIEDIRRQTLAIKRSKRYLLSFIDMAFGRFVFSLYSTKRQKKFYQKFYPLWGGVTNMDLNSLWPQEDSEIPIDYLRAVSTDPVNKLVLSVTTIGRTMNISLTSHSKIFSSQGIEEFKNCFLKSLEQLR